MPVWKRKTAWRRGWIVCFPARIWALLVTQEEHFLCEINEKKKHEKKENNVLKFYMCVKNVPQKELKQEKKKNNKI